MSNRLAAEQRAAASELLAGVKNSGKNIGLRCHAAAEWLVLVVAISSGQVDGNSMPLPVFNLVGYLFTFDFHDILKVCRSLSKEELKPPLDRI